MSCFTEAVPYVAQAITISALFASSCCKTFTFEVGVRQRAGMSGE